jgi:hypothetical protein
MTRGRFSTCRCCGALTTSAYCDACGRHRAQRDTVVHDVVTALWGKAGAASFQTELRARRLTARRATKPERTKPA